LARLKQHANRRIDRDDVRLAIAILQCARRVSGAGAEIENNVWLQADEVQAFE
jgi:hypothetical protein